MDLTIEDVAQLLDVSEETIQGWISKKEIPVYQFNHQYLFSRMEIEKWMLDCKLNPTQECISFDKGEDRQAVGVVGKQKYSLFRAIHQGDVLIDVLGKTKEEVIRNSVKVVSKKLAFDEDLVIELLLDREKLMPTALNQGIAVPHPRDLIMQEQADKIVVAFLKTPIAFGALDGLPVHTLFFLFSSQDKNHLHLLAKIAHASSQSAFLTFLQSKPDKERLLAFIRSWESTLKE